MPTTDPEPIEPHEHVCPACGERWRHNQRTDARQACLPLCTPCLTQLARLVELRQALGPAEGEEMADGA